MNLLEGINPVNTDLKPSRRFPKPASVEATIRLKWVDPCSLVRVYEKQRLFNATMSNRIFAQHAPNGSDVVA